MNEERGEYTYSNGETPVVTRMVFREQWAQAAIDRQQAALVAELKARVADICRGVDTDAAVEALETVTQWVESGGLENGG